MSQPCIQSISVEPFIYHLVFTDTFGFIIADAPISAPGKVTHPITETGANRFQRKERRILLLLHRTQLRTQMFYWNHLGFATQGMAVSVEVWIALKWCSPAPLSPG